MRTCAQCLNDFLKNVKNQQTEITLINKYKPDNKMKFGNPLTFSKI